MQDLSCIHWSCIFPVGWFFLFKKDDEWSFLLVGSFQLEEEGWLIYDLFYMAGYFLLDRSFLYKQDDIWSFLLVKDITSCQGLLRDTLDNYCTLYSISYFSATDKSPSCQDHKLHTQPIDGKTLLTAINCEVKIFSRTLSGSRGPIALTLHFIVPIQV